MSDVYVALSTGSVEYAVKDAGTPIEDLIATLEEAKDDGATHVVLESGNYRGAKWQRVEPSYEFVD